MVMIIKYTIQFRVFYLVSKPVVPLQSDIFTSYWVKVDLQTRMHSSRMRTGRTLTVFRKLEDPPGKFGAGTPPKIWSRHPPENLEQAPPPKIWSRHPPRPPKIWSRHPPENLEQAPPRKFGAGTPPPPRKFGAGTPRKFGAGTPPTPPSVDRHTLVKILPWPKLRFGR